MMKLVKFITFGCKVNQYETEVLREKLSEIGYISAKQGETPQLAVINSCAVTAEGERKMRQTLRRIKKDYPEITVLLMGCVSQVFPESAKDLPADIILGNTNVLDAVEAIKEYNGSSWDTESLDPYSVIPLKHSGSIQMYLAKSTGPVYMGVEYGVFGKFRFMTQAAYDALSSYDNDTIYFVRSS